MNASAYPVVAAAARAALAAGLSIVPPCEDGSKRPLGAWKRFMTALPAASEVQSWYGPRTGLGIVCGSISGNLECLEFDAEGMVYPSFKAAAAAVGLADLVERLERGYLERSPSGGIHWLYRCDTIAGNTPLARYESDELDASGKPIKKPLIETRGEGGYIITAPSNGRVHPTGGTYELLAGSFETIPHITPEERQALFDLARSFDQLPEPEPPGPKGNRPDPQGATWPDTITPWDDFEARTTWPEVLPAGWECVHQHGQTEYWRRPGKSEGHSATINRDGSNRLFVFSSATDFEPGKPYSRFDAFARLEHSDNAKAAARALYEAGYGTHKRWVDVDGKWVLRIFPNPCPRGERIARPGEPPPPPHRPGPERNDHAAGPRAEGAADDDPEAGEVIDHWPHAEAHLFHGLAGEIVRTADPLTEADPVATLVQLLVAFGSMIGRGPHFVVGATRHHLNLFVVLVGLTALGRKGTSWDIARWILRASDPEWADERIQSGLISGEGLIHHVRDPRWEEHHDRNSGETETVLVDPGVTDKRLLVVETEFARTLKTMNRDTCTLSDVMKQAWDSGRLRTLAKNHPVMATDAHISIIGHITQADVVRHLTETDSNNGFANRFLWTASRRSKELPDGPDMMSVNWTEIHRRMAEVVPFARGVGKMTRDKQAREVWHAVYSELCSDKAGLVGAVLSRAPAQVMRLACVYALLELSAVVRAEHMVAALALWKYGEDSVRLVFGNGIDSASEKLLEALRAAPKGLTRWQIYTDVFQNHKKSNQILTVLSELLTQGMIHQQLDNETGGRPTQRWLAGRGSDEKRDA